MGVRYLGSQGFNLQVLCLLVLGCEGSPVTQPISNQILTETQHFGVRVCPEGPTVEGVDVSVYQEVIDWDALANSEIKYAIMRTGYGTGTLDTQFERNWAESERVGIIRGVYHFFRANQ
ncbi:MAG: GH25 family lysozyme, partial [Bradymonadia bacterium]